MALHGAAGAGGPGEDAHGLGWAAQPDVHAGAADGQNQGHVRGRHQDPALGRLLCRPPCNA